jgi:septal ring factor EnvC (AmiA/AmiB activator)
MKQEDSTTQPDQPTPKATDTPQAPIQSEPISVPAETKKARPGRLQRFFRKALVWLIVVAFAFLAGMIADHYLRYRPLSEDLAHTRTELDHANQSISDLQAELERLNTTIQEANDRVASLEGGRKSLQEELDTARAHLELLQVLVEISNARLALFLNDTEGAKAALVSTPQRLDNLSPHITEFDANLAQNMSQRLSLIITGLERDTETAKIDLELLTKNLLDIEAALFGD